MMYIGVATMALPSHEHSRLGIIYEHRSALVAFGLIFFSSGLILLVGKLLKMKHVIGWGLMAIYLCFFFATILVWYGEGWKDAVPNAIGTSITGGLYLRWKYDILYVDKRHSIITYPNDLTRSTG